jgi:hypothetical protein
MIISCALGVINGQFENEFARVLTSDSLDKESQNEFGGIELLCCFTLEFRLLRLLELETDVCGILNVEYGVGLSKCT